MKRLQVELKRVETMAQAGRLDAALAELTQLRAQHSDHPLLLNAAARLSLAKGDRSQAVSLSQQAIARAPHAPGLRLSYADILAGIGRLDDACGELEHVVRVAPAAVAAWERLGTVCLRKRDLPRAEQVGARLLQLAPRRAAGVRLLARVALARQDFTQAESLLARWRRAAPSDAEPLSLLGELASRSRRFDEAEVHLRAALQRAPGSDEARTRWADHLARVGDFEDAHAIFEDLVRASPEGGARQANLGIARAWVGDLTGAVESLSRAVELAPGDPTHRWNLSHALLQVGRLAEGFSEMERRVDLFRRPTWWPQRWQGESLPPDTPLVLDAAQGLGDALQFVRFAQGARARGAWPVVRAHPRLLPLLRSCDGVCEAVPSDAPVPPGARRASLLSLPHALGCATPESLGDMVPYLHAEPERVAWVRSRLARHAGKLRVGIVWQGNPNYSGDHLRSPPLRHYLPLARIPGVQLVSLQKFHGLEQLAAAPPSIDLLSVELDVDTAFVDTAAAMCALDLVLTSDTSTAHLAGGLGVPTWVVLPFAPDWRWPRMGATTPWYPTMRLFRQQESREWPAVFAEVHAAMSTLAAEPRSPPC